MAHQSGISGISANWYILSPGVDGSYADGTWSTTAPMNVARQYFSSNVLTNGKLLVTGGEYSDDHPANNFSGFSFTSSGEIYDPAANTWTPTDTFHGAPLTPYNWGGGPAPTELLPNGRVLAGSAWSPGTFQFDSTVAPGNNLQWVDSGYKVHFDGTANTLPDANGDNSQEEGSALLPGGDVLVYSIHRGDVAGNLRADLYRYATGNGWTPATRPTLRLAPMARAADSSSKRQFHRVCGNDSCQR